MAAKGPDALPLGHLTSQVTWLQRLRPSWQAAHTLAYPLTPQPLGHMPSQHLCLASHSAVLAAPRWQYLGARLLEAIHLYLAVQHRPEAVHPALVTPPLVTPAMPQSRAVSLPWFNSSNPWLWSAGYQRPLHLGKQLQLLRQQQLLPLEGTEPWMGGWSAALSRPCRLIRMC
jgi:hypothetical protein